MEHSLAVQMMDYWFLLVLYERICKDGIGLSPIPRQLLAHVACRLSCMRRVTGRIT